MQIPYRECPLIVQTIALSRAYPHSIPGMRQGGTPAIAFREWARRFCQWSWVTGIGKRASYVIALLRCCVVACFRHPLQPRASYL
jgi:hypothetical protein